jgi:hypothetical protein
MPRPRRRKPDRRRALELLASYRDGCTEAIMLAHGFSIAQMVELVRAGLASAIGERGRETRARWKSRRWGIEAGRRTARWE